eukprot:1152286-Pelagomonas_calceolata.AAC.3
MTFTRLANRPVVRWLGTLCGRALAVPVGHNCNQPNSMHSQPFPVPDEFQLHDIVAQHISQIIPTLSPGFITILPTFL